MNRRKYAWSAGACCGARLPVRRVAGDESRRASAGRCSAPWPRPGLFCIGLLASQNACGAELRRTCAPLPGPVLPLPVIPTTTPCMTRGSADKQSGLGTPPPSSGRSAPRYRVPGGAIVQRSVTRKARMATCRSGNERVGTRGGPCRWRGARRARARLGYAPRYGGRRRRVGRRSGGFARCLVICWLFASSRAPTRIE